MSWDVQQFMNTPWALDPQSRWEVALTEFALPKTFQTYPDRLNPLSFTFHADDEELQTFTLPETNFYHSPKDLIDCMTALMEDASSIEHIVMSASDTDTDDEDAEGDDSSTTQESSKLCDYVQFHYDSCTLRVLLRIKKQPPSDIRLTFSDGLKELFSLEDDEYEIKSAYHDGQFERVVFSEMFNFSLFTDYIHILLQEANMSFINNKTIPWLYSCSIGSSSVVSHTHTHIILKPVSLCYVPLNYVNSMRNKLHLSVVDDDMEILSPLKCIYRHNMTMFHLHFRNILPGR